MTDETASASDVQTPMEFVSTRPDVEASIMHIGLNNTQVVLVAGTGEWLRYVVPDVELAKQMCERLGVPYHDGYPEHLRMRMGSYQRSNEDWAAAPYPERYRGTST